MVRIFWMNPLGFSTGGVSSVGRSRFCQSSVSSVISSAISLASKSPTTANSVLFGTNTAS